MRVKREEVKFKIAGQRYFLKLTFSDMPGFNTLQAQKDAISPPVALTLPHIHSLAKPHIESFNSLFENNGLGLLEKATTDIPKVTVFDGLPESELKDRKKLVMWISNPTVAKPMQSDLLYPAECRERGISYKAKMEAKLNWRVDDGPINSQVQSLGYLPVMVKVQVLFVTNRV